VGAVFAEEAILPAYNCRFRLTRCHLPMPKAAAPAAIPAPLTYEAALQELEALVARVESGQLPLDDLLAGYQRGAELLKICRDKLQAVEQQIKLLDGKPGGGAGDEAKPWIQE
jgi:exodeoxyribonuclease VII small subunit